MMLRLFLRLERWSVLTFGLGVGLLGLINSVAFVETIGKTAADRAAFATQIGVIGSQFSIIAPIPVQVGTIAGYMQWRYYGAQVPILLTIWAVTAGTSLRGLEDRGLVDACLASGPSRFALLAWKAVAFALALAAAVASMAILSQLGAGSEIGLGWGGLLADGIAAAALTLALFAAGVLAAQLAATRREAAGLAGGAVLVLFLLNGLGRSDATFGRLRWLSPFYWYEKTNALLAGGGFDFGATLLLALVALALLTLAWLCFRARDLGSPLVRLRARQQAPARRASASPALELPVMAGLYEQRLALALWALGMAAFADLMVIEARPLANAIAGIPALAPYLTHIKAALFVAFLDTVGFGIAAPLLAVFAITQVSRWAADDAEGRLEMVLAAGARRERVVVERMSGLALGAAVISAVTGAVMFVAARAGGFDLDAGRVALAAALLVLLCVCFGAAGSVLAGWRPRLAVGVLTFLTVAGYFLTELGPILKWPDWIQNLSPFHLYGNPLSQGIYWTGVDAMVAITLVGLALSVLAMRLREIGR